METMRDLADRAGAALRRADPRVRAGLGFGLGAGATGAMVAILLAAVTPATLDSPKAFEAQPMRASVETPRPTLDLSMIETASTPTAVAIFRPYAQRARSGELNLYLTMLNRGSVDDRLIAVVGADGVRFDLIDNAGRGVAALDAPRGVAIVLEPGRARLRRAEDAQPLAEPGLAVTLMFERGGPVDVVARVAGAGGGDGLRLGRSAVTVVDGAEPTPGRPGEPAPGHDQR